MTHVSRPDTTGAGAPGRNDEIEITPEMIAAGVDACSFWDIGDPDEWKAVDIYRQMERARLTTASEAFPSVAAQNSAIRRTIDR